MYICIHRAKNNENVLQKEGLGQHIIHDLTYLVGIEDNDKSHYIYISKIEHLITISNCSADKDKRFCPICKCKILMNEFNHMCHCVITSRQKAH